LEGLLAPFCLIFQICKKGKATACKKSKKSAKYRSFACGNQIPPCTLQRGHWSPFEQIACRIHELHATPTLAIYRWDNLIFKKWEQVLKFCSVIWWDGNFNYSPNIVPKIVCTLKAYGLKSSKSKGKRQVTNTMICDRKFLSKS
jgi:hypothetical protein